MGKESVPAEMPRTGHLTPENAGDSVEEQLSD